MTAAASGERGYGKGPQVEIFDGADTLGDATLARKYINRGVVPKATMQRIVQAGADLAESAIEECDVKTYCAVMDVIISSARVHCRVLPSKPCDDS